MVARRFAGLEANVVEIAEELLDHDTQLALGEVDAEAVTPITPGWDPKERD